MCDRLPTPIAAQLQKRTESREGRTKLPRLLRAWAFGDLYEVFRAQPFGKSSLNLAGVQSQVVMRRDTRLIERQPDRRPRH